MATSKSKLLIILDLNETLLLLFKKARAVSFGGSDELLRTMKYDETVGPYQVRYRGGRTQFLEAMFHTHQDKFETAVWSTLSREDTQSICTSYFGRYYRNLLFVLPTRREQYEGKSGKDNYHPLPIKRDLSQIFTQFPAYEEANTFVVSTQPNLVEKYRPNDLLLPSYSPASLSTQFDVDPGMTALVKYLVGISQMMKQKNIDDARSIATVKSIKTLFEKVSHNMFTPRDFV